MPLAELQKSLKGRARESIPLKDFVAFHIGGPAEIFVEPKDEEDIRASADFALRHQLDFHILGNGSNLLVRDGGVRGVVVYLGSLLSESWQILREDSHTVELRVSSALAKARLLELALERAWSGLEFSAGIPGTLGGAVFMNAGTKWGSYGEVVERVRFYSPEKGFFEKTRAELGFKYRGHGEGLFDASTVIVSVDLKLGKDKKPEEIRSLVDEILCYRGGKQPLELPNCGSVFKNPENSPRGAGRLIEACGLKGLQRGQAQVSLKHANFILNRGDARAADVEALITEIQLRVEEKEKIHLEPEVIFWGQAK